MSVIFSEKLLKDEIVLIPVYHKKNYITGEIEHTPCVIVDNAAFPPLKGKTRIVYEYHHGDICGDVVDCSMVSPPRIPITPGLCFWDVPTLNLSQDDADFVLHGDIKKSYDAPSDIAVCVKATLEYFSTEKTQINIQKEIGAHITGVLHRVIEASSPYILPFHHELAYIRSKFGKHICSDIVSIAQKPTSKSFFPFHDRFNVLSEINRKKSKERKTRTAQLRPHDFEIAKAIGRGDVTEGVRIALQAYNDHPSGAKPSRSE